MTTSSPLCEGGILSDSRGKTNATGDCGAYCHIKWPSLNLCFSVEGAREKMGQTRAFQWLTLLSASPLHALPLPLIFFPVGLRVKAESTGPIKLFLSRKTFLQCSPATRTEYAYWKWGRGQKRCDARMSVHSHSTKAQAPPSNQEQLLNHTECQQRQKRDVRLWKMCWRIMQSSESASKSW